MTLNTIDELLERGRRVTEAMQKEKIMTPDKQILKMFEEVGEVLKAKTNLEILEECCDVIYSALTLMHVQGYADYAIKEALNSTMGKIERRAGIKKEFRDYFTAEEISCMNNGCEHGFKHWEFCPNADCLQHKIVEKAKRLKKELGIVSD